MRFLDKFPALLLDMNGTFMFGEDRFGAGEDFHATYRSVGGRRLSAAEVTRFIRACYDGSGKGSKILRRYRVAAWVVANERQASHWSA